MQQNECICLRGRSDCVSLSGIPSTELDEQGQPKSFICVGANTQESRTMKQDRFTLCWHNDVIDERGHWDKRDLIDTASTILHALSVDENIRVSTGIDAESEMQDLNFK